MSQLPCMGQSYLSFKTRIKDLTKVLMAVDEEFEI